MNFSAILDALAERRDLSSESADFAFNELMTGNLSPAQAGAFLMLLRAKGETPEEIAAAVRGALAQARQTSLPSGIRIDTCGTGGDGKHTFNCSTAVALYLAGMGYKVVKHGNRAVSSGCGSADVVEALGLPLQVEPADLSKELEKRNFVFLFAPKYHPAFAKIGPIRKELGVRTLFNILGPLLNPARPSHQIIGAAKPEIAGKMAATLAHLKEVKAAVYHGAGGYDELTAFGASHVSWVREGEIIQEVMSPADYGFIPPNREELSCRDKESAIAVLRDLLKGQGPKPMQDMIALNLALALLLLEHAGSYALCLEAAKSAIAAGAAMKVLDA